MSQQQCVVLCIDDDTPGLTVRAMLLESRGYSVMKATSGREGLQLLRNNPEVRLVVLDYAMPEMHGGEVAVEIRKLRPELPVVLLSAYYSIPEETLEITDAFVTKGEPPHMLLGTIEQLLDGKANVGGADA